MSRLREESRKLRSDYDELQLRYDDEVYNGGSWKKDKERLETKIQDVTKAYDASVAAQAEQQSQIVALHSQVRELRSVLNDAETDRARVSEEATLGRRMFLDEVLRLGLSESESVSLLGGSARRRCIHPQHVNRSSKSEGLIERTLSFGFMLSATYSSPLPSSVESSSSCAFFGVTSGEGCFFTRAGVVAVASLRVSTASGPSQSTMEYRKSEFCPDN